MVQPSPVAKTAEATPKDKEPVKENEAKPAEKAITETPAKVEAHEKTRKAGEHELRVATHVEKNGAKTAPATASLYVNGFEVAHFRSPWENLTPEQRAELAMARLATYLEAGGSAVDILIGERKNTRTVEAGGALLYWVDETTAAAAGGHSSDSLAKLWHWRLQMALTGQLGDTLEDEKPVLETTVIKAGPDVIGRHYKVVSTAHGKASWYGPKFHGRRTASGERFDMNRYTAAHRQLPFGTLVRVTNQRTKKACIVKINDRGPYGHGRIIDLSRAAAKTIGLMSSGIGRVTLEVISLPH